MDKEEAEKFNERIERYSIKTRRVVARYVDDEGLRVIHGFAVDKKKMWDLMIVKVEKAIKEVLDRYGVTGTFRITYYDCGRKLFSSLLKYPERAWEKLIVPIREYYVNKEGVKQEVVDKVIEMVVQVTKEIKYEPVAVEDGGQKG
jgi:hypothetical protein